MSDPSRIGIVRQISLDDIRVPPREQFVLGHMFPFGKASVFYGPTSIGKSAALAQVVFAFGGGAEELWGLPLHPGGGAVLVYTAEDTLDDWIRKAAAVLASGDILTPRALSNVYIIDKTEGFARLSEIVTERTNSTSQCSQTRRVGKPTPERDWVVAEAKRLGVKLIVFETASRLVEEEDNATFSVLQSDLGYIGRETGAAVIVSHHTTKAASKNNDSSIESARGGGALVANARNAVSLFLAGDDGKGLRGKFHRDDLVVLGHAKATSSTRRQAAIVLVRCDGGSGAVFRLPNEVTLSPEQETKNQERLEEHRERELEDLRKLYAVVEKYLPTRPRISPSWLRDHQLNELGGVPKGKVEGLVQRALHQGVLKLAGQNKRGIWVMLGADPRKPINESAPAKANPGESTGGAA